MISTRDVMKAIKSNNKEQLDSYLNEGFDIGFVTENDKWNILHKSLAFIRADPSPEVIQYLVDKGVNVNARDRYLNTPLHYAARLKKPKLIEVLLDAGAEIDAVNEEGVTPLRQTLLSNPLDFDSTSLLLNRGADPEHRTTGGSVRDYVRTTCHEKEYADILKLFS